MTTQTTAASAPKSKKGLIVVAVLALAAIGAAIAGFVLYDTVTHEPQAHKHLPPGALLASRVDGLKLLTFKPVRDHLWPVLLEDTDGGDKPDSERVDNIAKYTGISAADLREVVTASTSATDWVVLVGGKFEPGRFVSGMEKAFKAEDVSGWSLAGEMLKHTSGFVLAQAEDGTLIFATNQTLAKACLPQTDQTNSLPLPVDGALSFALTHKAYDDAIGKIPMKLPGTAALAKIDTLSGHVMLTEAPTVQLRGVPRKGNDAEAVAGDVRSLLGQLNLALMLVPGSLGGAKSALSGAEVKALDGKVAVDTKWPYKELDSAIKQLAEGIRRSRSLRGK